MLRIFIQLFFLTTILSALSLNVYARNEQIKCAHDLKLSAEVEFGLHRPLLGGDLPRRAVEQFSQKDKKVSLRASIELVRTWLSEYYRYADRLKDMDLGLEKTLVRLALLENEWKTYQKKPPYRFKIPNGVSVEEEEVIPIDDPQGTSVYIGSKRDAYKHYRDEFNTKNDILRLIENEMRAQAIRHYRFDIILKNRGETPEVAIPDSIKGLSRTRLELIKDIQDVMNPDQALADEMHPERELRVWAKLLARKDSARRLIMRRYYLDVPSRSWNWISEKFMTIDEKKKKKLFPILFISGSIGTATLLMSQMMNIRQQTKDIVQLVEEKTKTAEQIKKETEERKKVEEQKKLLAEAKDIAEKTNTWKELREGFITFSGHFPAESSKIFAEYHLGKRKNLEPDESFDAYYFKVAKEIEEWWSRIYDGYTKDGVELIYGAKGRTDIKTEAAELLEAFFEKLENPPPPPPVEKAPPPAVKKPKKPS